MKIVLPTRYLRAALICAADQDVRYYLNGVCIEATGTEVFIVSTNGHYLFAARVETETEAGQWIIPREVLEAAFSLIKEEEPLDAEDEWVPFYPDSAILNVTDAETSLEFGGITFGLGTIYMTAPFVG